MSDTEDDSFRRYLEAKRTVDARARNRQVRDAVRDALEGVDDPVAVCELGAGTGAMAERLLDWTDGQELRYTAFDTDPTVLAAAVDNVAARAEAAGHETALADRTLTVDRGGGGARLEFRVADALDHLETTERTYDVVVGQAFLDLTDVRAAIEAVAGVLDVGGFGYFPITFDGVTALLPRVDPDFDDLVERRYHRRMDKTPKAGDATGDSQAGRRLLTAVPETGGRVVAAGGSDWVVTPSDGGYPADEAYFLHHVVETIGDALADDAVDQPRLAAWRRARHAQVRSGDLVYLAHQLDVLGRW